MVNVASVDHPRQHHVTRNPCPFPRLRRAKMGKREPLWTWPNSGSRSRRRKKLGRTEGQRTASATCRRLSRHRFLPSFSPPPLGTLLSRPHRSLSFATPIPACAYFLAFASGCLFAVQLPPSLDAPRRYPSPVDDLPHQPGGTRRCRPGERLAGNPTRSPPFQTASV